MNEKGRWRKCARTLNTALDSTHRFSRTMMQRKECLRETRGRKSSLERDVVGAVQLPKSDADGQGQATETEESKYVNYSLKHWQNQ